MPILNSKYTKDFHSDNITDLKYNQLYNLAVLIRNFKNTISKEICSDLLTYLNMSKFDFMKYVRNHHRHELCSYFECEAYSDVYNAYQNKFDALTLKIQFKHRQFICFNYYKKDVKKKNKKKGDFKSISYKLLSTPLSICLTYLARYGNENIINYIQENYDKVDYKKQVFYDNILKCCNKFGFNRLYDLALLKRNRIISKYSAYPIEFKSLNFRGLTKPLTNIIDYNSNKKSIISGFASISTPTGLINIPVKLSNKYHGKLSDYQKANRKMQYCYTLKLDTFKKSVIIQICKDSLRIYPDNKTNYIGIDVNVKNNLFSLSNGQTYDFDRLLVKEYIKELNIINNLKSKNKDYQPGKRKQHKLDIFRRCIKHSNERLISSICKELNLQGYDHVIMENLDNSFKRSHVKNKEINEKYTRLNHILNMGSLKNEFKHIAQNYDICVSFVQAEYTSQMCPICGSIHERNRYELETFECINCGHTANADYNAAVNIRNRVSETVFQQNLLKQSTDGSYIPKPFNHELVKDKIQKCVIQLYRNVLKIG